MLGVVFLVEKLVEAQRKPPSLPIPLRDPFDPVDLPGNPRPVPFQEALRPHVDFLKQHLEYAVQTVKVLIPRLDHADQLGGDMELDIRTCAGMPVSENILHERDQPAVALDV